MVDIKPVSYGNLFKKLGDASRSRLPSPHRSGWRTPPATREVEEAQLTSAPLWGGVVSSLATYPPLPFITLTYAGHRHQGLAH